MSKCTCLYVALLCVSLISFMKPNVSTSIYVKSTTPLCLRHVKLQWLHLKCAHTHNRFFWPQCGALWSCQMLESESDDLCDWPPSSSSAYRWMFSQPDLLPQSHYLLLFGLEAHCAGKVQLRSRRSFGPKSDIWQTGVPPSCLYNSEGLFDFLTASLCQSL